jgi:hypothetical protein
MTRSGLPGPCSTSLHARARLVADPRRWILDPTVYSVEKAPHADVTAAHNSGAMVGPSGT